MDIFLTDEQDDPLPTGGLIELAHVAMRPKGCRIPPSWTSLSSTITDGRAQR